MILLKAFSVVLAAGALALLLHEWRFYRRSFRGSVEMLSPAPDTARLLRRAVGSALLFTLSALLFGGKLPDPGVADQEQVMRLFFYWLSVSGLALLLGLLALVDAVAGVKKLGSLVSLEQARELSALAEQLRDAQVDPAALERLPS